MPASTTAVKSPGSCSSTWFSRSVESTTSPSSRSIDTARRVRTSAASAAVRRAQRRSATPGPLQRVRAVRARHLAAEPRRRENLPRVRDPVRIERRAEARIAARSSAPNSFGIEHALSTPTPCSPVSEPPASMHTSRIAVASCLGPLGLAREPRRRRARAGGGCRRRHGRRWRSGVRTPSPSA